MSAFADMMKFGIRPSGARRWLTALSDWSLRRTPFWKRTQRDPIKELSDACHEAGLVFCLYYSIPDWNYPDFPAQYSQKNMKGNKSAFHGSPKPDVDIKKYSEYMKGQLRELLTKYGPIGIIWFDGGGSFKGVDRPGLLGSKEIIDLIHQLQPACLVNNRLDEKLGDYGTPEQKIPGGKMKEAFEVCMTLNKHWGYNKADHAWKEPPEVIQKLADIAHKGGNFLLNVGPTSQGIIPADSVRILSTVGKWMSVNSESIYATGPCPTDEIPKWGRITTKPGKIYLHVFEWPRTGKIQVNGITPKITKASLLADPARTGIAATIEGSALTVTLPGTAPDPVDSVIVLETAD